MRRRIFLNLSIGTATAVTAARNAGAQERLIAANRSAFVVGPVTDGIIATQQGVADGFYKLGLIPKPVVVRGAVWTPVAS